MIDIVDFCEKYKTNEIQNEIKNRGITRLCHMTTMENQLSILEEDTGILADDYINEEKLNRNDLDRLDGRTDYISTSMQYPNVWYLNYRRKISSASKDWAIIFIDSDICGINNTLFSPVNAAKAYGAYLSIGASALKTSFSEVVNGRVRPTNMFSCCPTDDQAEVMIYKEIPVEYFMGIAFESKKAMVRFLDLAERYELSYQDLYIAPDLFTTQLSSKIRLEIEPQEIKVMEESKIWQIGLCSQRRILIHLVLSQ